MRGVDPAVRRRSDMRISTPIIHIGTYSGARGVSRMSILLLKTPRPTRYGRRIMSAYQHRPRANTPRRPLLIGGLVVALLAAVGFGGYTVGAESGWWGRSSRLTALVEDPIVGRVVADHPRLGLEVSTPAGLFAKATPDVVAACYSTGGSSPSQVRGDIVRAAETLGFHVDDAATDSQTTVLNRDASSPENRTCLIIDENPSNPPGAVSEPCVSVRL